MAATKVIGTLIFANSLLKKWKEGVRSKFSDYDFREKTIVSPKIGPDPDFFNRLLIRTNQHMFPQDLHSD